MGKIGFIGFGAMGSVLVKSLLESRTIAENQVILATRTPAKLEAFAIQHPKVEIVDSIKELAIKSSRVFICTGTKEVKAVLEELVRYSSKDIHIITITGVIEMKCLESIFKGRISRTMPTQIAEVGEGVTLVIHNSQVLPADREFISSTLGKIGRVKEITENQMDLAADLAGCAPAFYAAILQNLVEVAQKRGSLTVDEIKEISLETLYGTVKLLLETGADFAGLIDRVATRGGITEEGVTILDRALPVVFDDVLTATLSKRATIRAQMREQYGLK